MTTFNYKGEPIIPTRGMEDALTKIISALEVDYRGIGFHSLTRFGKSTLAQFICANTEWTECKYVAKQANLRVLGPGESAFLDWFISQLGSQVISHQAADRKIERIVNTVDLMLRSAGGGSLFFIADDANLLEQAAFQHFITIDNALEKKGISLFVIFLFQDNHTSSRREEINRTTVTPQVRGRFLTRYHRLHGIRGALDVETFLERFEDEVEASAGAGVTLPRSLSPELYDGEFRLRHFSEQIWNAGCSCRAAAGHSSQDEWPLKAMRLIAYYLATRVICKIGFKEVTSSDIEMSVAFSDLAAFDGESGALTFTADGGING